jgi:hypothetical protein
MYCTVVTDSAKVTASYYVLPTMYEQSSGVKVSSSTGGGLSPLLLSVVMLAAGAPIVSNRSQAWCGQMSQLAVFQVQAVSTFQGTSNTQSQGLWAITTSKRQF